ncbi:MAG: RagB/SusD family nutrient uptake outer membrane protein [Prevotellaceae bacterium]|nr:RagB/SusD family nutrient uptake outer membrane protein [Prevotellaceae bacterium]
MKTAKYATRIAAAAAVTVCAAACEDWLDMPSETKYDSSSIFISPEKAEMAVLGAYASAYHNDLNYRLMSGSDECRSTETNSKYTLAQYEHDASNVPDGVYTTMYTTIERANSCIKGISSMDTENPKVAQLLGEAYAIRAWAYFNAVRFWGDVPFQLLPTIDADTYELPRYPRDEIYDQCVKDLQTAVDLLPWKDVSGVASERFSKNAALGILARVALHAAGYSLRWDLSVTPYTGAQLAKRPDVARITELYTIARDACKRVMDEGGHELLANYDQLYRDLATKKYNKETIWEFGMFGASQTDKSPGYTSGTTMPANTIYSKSGPLVAPMPTLYFDYDSLDQRRDVSLCNIPVALEEGALVARMSNYASVKIGKYRVTWKANNEYGDGRTNINMPLLRYSDILLMFAEAENELSGAPTAAAVKAYEDVRTRAFGGNADLTGSTPGDKQGFFEALVKERKLELCFEGAALRRTDLVRWGIHYETLRAEADKMIRLGNATGEYANIWGYASYKPMVMDKLEHPAIAIPAYQYYRDKPAPADSAALANDGYAIVDLCRGFFTTDDKTTLNDWVVEFFSGVTKNKTELMPFSNAMMNDNPMIRNQQHPGY